MIDKVRKWLRHSSPPHEESRSQSLPPALLDALVLAHPGAAKPLSWPTHASAPDRTHLGGFVDSATSIGDKAVQEDACGHIDLPVCKAVAVADGISSSVEAHLAAQTAVQTTLATLSRCCPAGYLITPAVALKQAFTEAQMAVRIQAQARGKTANPPATTLIVALELHDRFVLGYVGDGAAVFSTGKLQWMANLLFPHTGQAGSITHYLGADSALVEPTCIELPKVWPDGGIILLGTDGALPLGQVLQTTERILQQLQDKVIAGATTRSKVDAHGVLEEWVTSRLTTDDNRTLGIIVSERALAYWHDLAQRHEPQKMGDRENEAEGCSETHDSTRDPTWQSAG